MHFEICPQYWPFYLRAVDVDRVVSGTVIYLFNCDLMTCFEVT